MNFVMLLFLSTNGASTSQPRATPWVLKESRHSPEGAEQQWAFRLSRPYRACFSCDGIPGRCPGLACSGPVARCYRLFAKVHNTL